MPAQVEMNAGELRNLIQQMAVGIGQRGVALRCDCENLETVHVVVDEESVVRVTDLHETLQYLGEGTDSAYVPIEDIDLGVVARICQELGVELIPAALDGFPSMESVPKPEESVTDAVERVAEAIDRTFAYAMRPDLK
ncbi:MAG: hypothetical protein EOP83_24545 [Verrucomicrobiaceae bacterium]|nr:MAG: hypothetical protein EOP83_24545 [Verrucomicrobiaceae bacterium]